MWSTLGRVQVKQLPRLLVNVTSRHNRHFKKSAVAALIATVLVIDATSCKNDDNVKKENVGVYLKPESGALLNAYLATRGIKEQQILPSVTIVRNATKDEAHVYKPLYGQRAAFRLKGVMKSEDGHVVATGRISTMVGELREDDYEAALPLVNNSNDINDTEISMDMPTRHVRIGHEKEGMFWKGRLPPITLRGEHYPSMNKVTFTPIPKDKQIVLEGYICSSRYVDENGHCLYDRSADEEFATVETTTESVSSLDSPVERKDNDHNISNKNNTNSTDNVDNTATAAATATESIPSTSAEVSECPICKYMRAGPCRDEFLAWDACVQSATEETLASQCFAATSSMMKCMRQHEYYDIMTAGTDFSQLDKVEKESSARS